MADEEPKADEISEANSDVFGKLRDLAKDLEAVVEHESRVLEEEPPAKGPGASAGPTLLVRTFFETFSLL